MQRPRDHWPSQGTDLPVTEIEKRAIKAHVAFPIYIELCGFSRVSIDLYSDVKGNHRFPGSV